MNEKYPLISVIVPVYNTAAYLDECLSSIIAQTYPNLEIVVSDNGSTDESPRIIQKYASADHRVKAYVINHVDTPQESRICALRFAKGEWCICIDSDDYIESEYVNKLWARQQETNADYVGSLGRTLGKEQDMDKTRPEARFEMSRILSGTEAMLRTLTVWEFSANGAMIKRTKWERVLQTPLEDLYSDECDTRRILYDCEHVAFTNARYFYHDHPDSTGKSISYLSRFYYVFTYVGLIRFFEEEYGKDSILCQIYERKLAATLAQALKWLCKEYIKTKKPISKHFYQMTEEAVRIVKSAKFINKAKIKVLYYSNSFSYRRIIIK